MVVLEFVGNPGPWKKKKRYLVRMYLKFEILKTHAGTIDVSWRAVGGFWDGLENQFQNKTGLIKKEKRKKEEEEVDFTMPPSLASQLSLIRSKEERNCG